MYSGPLQLGCIARGTAMALFFFGFLFENIFGAQSLNRSATHVVEYQRGRDGGVARIIRTTPGRSTDACEGALFTAGSNPPGRDAGTRGAKRRGTSSVLTPPDEGTYRTVLESLASTKPGMHIVMVQDLDPAQPTNGLEVFALTDLEREMLDASQPHVLRPTDDGLILEMEIDQRSILSHKLSSIPRTKYSAAVESAVSALQAFQRDIKPFGPHLSTTHSFKDVLVQCVLATWFIDRGASRFAISKSIIATHWLDDIQDRFEHDLLKDFDFDGAADISGLLKTSEHGTLQGVLNVVMRDLTTRLPSSSADQESRLALFRFGLKRTLQGRKLFDAEAPDQAALERTWKGHQTELENLAVSVLGDDAQILTLIGDLNPHFVALSAKTLYEMVDVFNPEYDVTATILKGLLLGPMLFAYDSTREQEANEESPHAQPELNMVLRQLEIVANFVLKRSQATRRNVLEGLPAILESFGNLPPELTAKYLELFIVGMHEDLPSLRSPWTTPVNQRQMDSYLRGLLEAERITEAQRSELNGQFRQRNRSQN